MHTALHYPLSHLLLIRTVSSPFGTSPSPLLQFCLDFTRADASDLKNAVKRVAEVVQNAGWLALNAGGEVNELGQVSH
jgi:hypothetical protein